MIALQQTPKGCSFREMQGSDAGRGRWLSLVSIVALVTSVVSLYETVLKQAAHSAYVAMSDTHRGQSD
jgi:hypothetical protein